MPEVSYLNFLIVAEREISSNIIYKKAQMQLFIYFLQNIIIYMFKSFEQVGYS